MHSAFLSKPTLIQLMALALVMAVIAFPAVPAQAQTYTVVNDFFNERPNGPQYLQYVGAIPQGRDGNLYGISHEGGTSGIGTFFSVSPSGNEATLYSFDGSKGSYPNFGVNLGADGNFYGGTPLGGTANLGVIYQVTSAGVTTVLHNFLGTTDGASNGFPPTQGSDGNFYGTSNDRNGAYTPVFYQLTPQGIFKALHTLTSADGYDGSSPIQAIDGNFYGLGQVGGANNCGTFYKVSKTGVYKVLHDFTCTDGSQPFAPLVQAADGTFYGITHEGGTAGSYGVIFKVTTSGKLTVLHNMNPATDGDQSQAGLTLATDGNLYGTTASGGSAGQGTIFRITTAGVFSVLENFSSGAAALPGSTLTQHTNGLLYGDTYSGTGGDYGIFYSLDIGAKPFAKLALTSGLEGSTVGIFGQGFSKATSVTFGGTKATFTAAGDNYMTATVPAAAISGPVVVSIPTGNLTSSQIFKVKPTIASFTPPNGVVGTTVTITGTGLTQTTKVTFHGLSTTFTVVSDTKITTMVPAGATSGKIGVVTKGGTTTSKTSFTVN